MDMRPIIEITSDGSHTLFVPELEEHYHSINGAVQESRHVFIETGLFHFIKQKKTVINIFEVGFGTGLNAFLTLINAPRDFVVNYVSIEAYPLPMCIVTDLNYADNYNEEEQFLFKKLHEVEWGSMQAITPSFNLTKIEADFTKYLFTDLQQGIDITYFDAFAPDKQPEMWNQDFFNSLYESTNQKGILVTYCAKGVVRRMMQQAGYTTERLPGPPGKREMLRATK